MPPTVELELRLLVRVVVAAVLAGALGYERERAGKAAGFRTHMTVGVAAALFTVLSEYLVARSGEPRPLDLLRTIQAVATGVGFLGAGAIFLQDRRTRPVRGLTTAASVWATSAVGMTAGAGAYVLGAGVTGLLLVILHVLHRLGPAAPEPPEAERPTVQRAGRRPLTG